MEPTPRLEFQSLPAVLEVGLFRAIVASQGRLRVHLQPTSKVGSQTNKSRIHILDIWRFTDSQPNVIIDTMAMHRIDLVVVFVTPRMSVQNSEQVYEILACMQHFYTALLFTTILGNTSVQHLHLQNSHTSRKQVCTTPQAVSTDPVTHTELGLYCLVD